MKDVSTTKDSIDPDGIPSQDPGQNTGTNHGQNHLGQNINSYIQNLDVANVLAANLASLESNHNYIDPSLAATAYKRATLDSRRDRNEEDLSPQDDRQDYSEAQDEYDAQIPSLPPGADPKKMCPFCQRTFSHPGSMGRHLDLKKGTENHPADLIARMRADVKRRGDAEKVRERRRVRAKRYNAREDVKEKSRVKRRIREKVARARRIAMTSFMTNLAKPLLHYQPTFPRLVLYFLAPNLWPHAPPTLDTYRLLCGYLNTKFLDGQQGEHVQFYDEIMQKVHTASENWLTLTEAAKHDMWTRELRKAAEDALMNTSLFDLANRDNWVTQEARKTLQNNLKDGTDSEGDGDEDEDDNGVEGEGSIGIENSDKQRTTNFYSQDDLAAVAEAVIINNNAQHHN